MASPYSADKVLAAMVKDLRRMRREAGTSRGPDPELKEMLAHKKALTAELSEVRRTLKAAATSRDRSLTPEDAAALEAIRAALLAIQQRVSPTPVPEASQPSIAHPAADTATAATLPALVLPLQRRRPTPATAAARAARSRPA